MAGIVARVRRAARRARRLDLEACGEFLVLVAALLELKARGLFPEEDGRARRARAGGGGRGARAAARRVPPDEGGAGWLPSGSQRSASATSGSARRRSRRSSSAGSRRRTGALARRCALLAVEPPQVSLAHMALRFPPVSQFLERFRACSGGAALRLRRRRCVASRASSRRSRSWRCSSSRARRGLDRTGRAVRADQGLRGGPPSKGEARGQSAPPDPDQPARPARPHDRGAARRRVRCRCRSTSWRRRPRTTRSASRPRSGSSASATARAAAGSCSSTSPAAGPSAPSRDAADACARLFEQPAQRNLSQAALETFAIVAYLGPCSRPEIARIRGVAADSAVAGLVERGLITEAGRDDAVGGAVRYRTTPLFERVFGLEWLSAAAAARRPRRRRGRDPRAAARGRRAANCVGVLHRRTRLRHAIVSGARGSASRRLVPPGARRRRRACGELGRVQPRRASARARAASGPTERPTSGAARTFRARLKSAGARGGRRATLSTRSSLDARAREPSN